MNLYYITKIRQYCPKKRIFGGIIVILENNKPKYYIIEFNVLEDNRLSSTDKIIYSIINNLRNKKGFCFCTNNYIAKILNVDNKTIQRSITKLLRYGYLNRYTKNNKRYLITFSTQAINNIEIDESINNIEIENYNWLEE